MLSKRKRIVVIRQLGGIGDVIIMSAVYRGLKEKYPNSLIQLLTGSTYMSGALLDVAERNPFIDEVHIMEPYDGTTQNTINVWRKYYDGCPVIDDNPLLTKADLVIDLNTACVEYEWEAMNGDGIKKPRYQIWCERAGVVPSTYAPAYNLTDSDRKFANKVWSDRNLTGKTVIGVGVAACDPKRSIPIEISRQICQGLEARGYTPVVIDATFNFPEFNSFNGYRISEIIALISKLDVMVTVDTGLLHMAGAVDVPIVGIFGPTDPEMRMKPYRGSATDGSKLMPCSPCWYKYSCLNSKNPADHLRCTSKIDPMLIVHEVGRWVTNKDSERNLEHLRVL